MPMRQYLPPEGQVAQLAIPGPEWPSDHFSMVYDVNIVYEPEEQENIHKISEDSLEDLVDDPWVKEENMEDIRSQLERTFKIGQAPSGSDQIDGNFDKSQTWKMEYLEERLQTLQADIERYELMLSYLKPGQDSNLEIMHLRKIHELNSQKNKIIDNITQLVKGHQ